MPTPDVLPSSLHGAVCLSTWVYSASAGVKAAAPNQDGQSPSQWAHSTAVPVTWDVPNGTLYSLHTVYLIP